MLGHDAVRNYPHFPQFLAMRVQVLAVTKVALAAGSAAVALYSA